MRWKTSHFLCLMGTYFLSYSCAQLEIIYKISHVIVLICPPANFANDKPLRIVNHNISLMKYKYIKEDLKYAASYGFRLSCNC